MATPVTAQTNVNTANNTNTNSIEIENMLDLYWNYYQLHAEQRMKILEFFIEIEAALFCGVFVTYEKKMPSVSIVATVAITVVAILCFLLDMRTTELLHNCRLVLRDFESKYMAEDMRLFTKVKKAEETNTNTFIGKIKKYLKNNYTKVIRSSYLLVACAGIAMLIVA